MTDMLRNRPSTGQVAGQETGQVTISLSGQVHGADTKTDTKRIKKDTFGLSRFCLNTQ